jgi:hypothetical protein
MNKESEESEEFTKLGISTTTVTTRLFNDYLNIIDIAKYLPLDDQIVGVKLIYAGSKSIILRGNIKISKKRKDFLNQVTISLNVIDNNIVSCKIFHNGTMHITGTHNLDESIKVYNIIRSKISILSGLKMIKIIPDLSYVCSLDNLIYDHVGNIVGWRNDSSVNINNEYVLLENIEINQVLTKVFMSVDWKQNKKNVYSLNGKFIGNNLTFKLTVF